MIKVSKKQLAIEAERKKLRVILARQRGVFCEAKLNGCQRFWTDMHERLSRAQCGSPTDPANIIVLCRNCHRWITDHPREALKMGFRESRLVQFEPEGRSVNVGS